jgi:hypothetical protein
MSMFRNVVADGLIACVPFTVVVLTSFVLKPRLWLHSLPPDIQAMATPKTRAERHLTAWMGGVVLLCFFGIPILLTLRRHLLVAGGLSTVGSVAYLYGVWMVVNAWDLVGIDWPYAYWVDPSQPPIPGTEGALGYKDYGFHTRAFFKASVLGLAIIVPAGIAVSLIAGR